MISTITTKGQITLPVKIRQTLGLHTGDKISFILKDNHSIELIPVCTSVKSLKGMLPKHRKYVSIKDMNNAIEAAHDRA